MVLNGVNLKAVQEYLGHASPETIEVYVHLSDKLKRKSKAQLTVWIYNFSIVHLLYIRNCCAKPDVGGN